MLGVILLQSLPAKSAGISVKDMSGREVQVRESPKRIVCLGPGALRLIVYLKAEDRVVGVERMEKSFPRGRPYWIAHPELHDLPVCGPGGAASINRKPDMELLVRLAPEAVFVTYMKPALAERVQDTLGFPVIVLSYGTFANFDETVFDALRIAGRVLEREKRAEEVIDYVQSVRRDLEKRSRGAPADKKPRAYVGGLGYRGAHGLESTKQKYAPFDWVQAKNAAAELDVKNRDHLFINKEVLLSIDPDVIFIDSGGLHLVRRLFRRKPEVYNALKAFRHKRVYILHPFNWYTTNIGTVMTDAYTAGKILCGKNFSDIDPAKKADEIYTFMVGKPVYQKMKEHYGALGSKPEFVKKNN